MYSLKQFQQITNNQIAFAKKKKSHLVCFYMGADSLCPIANVAAPKNDAYYLLFDALNGAKMFPKNKVMLLAAASIGLASQQ